MDFSFNEPVSFVYASDRQRAIGFYCETLGLGLRSSDPFGDFIDAGGGVIRLTTMPDFTPSAHPAFGFHVEDIARAARALGERGVELARFEGIGQGDDGIWTAPDGAKVAWFHDSEGNLLSLAQL